MLARHGGGAGEGEPAAEDAAADPAEESVSAPLD
jgi:hypothetical protein